MSAILLLLQIAASAPGIQLSTQPGRSVDTTLSVDKSATLRLDAAAGRLTVRTWDRGAVRIVARPSRTTSIRIEASPTSVAVSSVVPTGVDEAEYDITVPRRMGLMLGSGDLAMDITGCEGDVVAKNYSGSITVSGSSGSLSVTSVLGTVEIRNSSGRTAVQVLYAPIRLVDVSGEVEVEGSANHLYLTRVDSKRLKASTVSGVIWFTGPFHPGASYFFATHSGSVIMSVVGEPNLTLHASTVNGAFSSPFPFTREQGSRRGKFTVRMREGAANVEVETYNGGIIVRPAGSEPKPPEDG